MQNTLMHESLAAVHTHTHTHTHTCNLKTREVVENTTLRVMSKEERELLKKIVLFLMRASVEKTLREVLQSKQGNQEEKRKENNLSLKHDMKALRLYTHTHTHM